MMGSGPGKPSRHAAAVPQLTPRAPGTPASPPPHLGLSRLLSALWSISLSSPPCNLLTPPPPNILIKIQGFLEVKEPHLVSSVCPPHSTDGETEAQRGQCLARGHSVSKWQQRPQAHVPGVPPRTACPVGSLPLSRLSERTSCERGAQDGGAGCWVARSRPA